MKLLALDPSTATGWALFSNGGLVDHGKIVHKADGDWESEDFPHNYIDAAKRMAFDIEKLALQFDVDKVVLEMTNLGKSRYHQKLLEWIHFAIIDRCKHLGVEYIDSSAWRKAIGLSMTKADREHNKHVKRDRERAKQDMLKQAEAELGGELQDALRSARNKREQNTIQKRFKKKMAHLASRKMRSYRTKINGSVVGQITDKTLSLRYVRENYNLELLVGDNDIADAICIGEGYLLLSNAS